MEVPLDAATPDETDLLAAGLGFEPAVVVVTLPGLVTGLGLDTRPAEGEVLPLPEEFKSARVFIGAEASNAAIERGPLGAGAARPVPDPLAA